MRHPTAVFTHAEYAELPLDQLRHEYLDDLEGRTRVPKPGTVIKYDAVLRLFIASLVRNGEVPTLSALHRTNVRTWVKDQHAAGISPQTVYSRLAALKVFAHKYIHRVCKYSTIDLLYDVENEMPAEKPKTGLTEQEREAILMCFTDPTFHDIRDRAIMYVTMATGLRFQEVMELPLANLDHRRGDLIVQGKGDKIRTARLSDRALKYLRQYLSERPRTECERLWVSEYGRALTYEGAHAIIKRVRKKSGVTRVTWHLFRHGFAQHALRAGAHPNTVQDMLGHSSMAMTRKYLGAVKQQEAARLMPQFSPV
jgi:site-specific recombinase XerD